jgi:hypothetical protein
MALITTRETAGTGATVKGSELRWDEVDYNFINVNTEVVGITSYFTTAKLKPANGGTGVANGTNNTVTFTGNYTLGVTLTNNTDVTFPTSGTLINSADTAAKATILATTRAIYGNNFDGSAALTGIIASTYGGTGNAYTKFTGPTTAEKTFTLPDASATLARTDAAQTFTGIQTVTSVTLPTNGQILLTVPTSDGHATGHTINLFNSGYTSSAVGDLVYLDSASTWQKCDANTLLLYNGLLGIALEVKASGNALLVALPGSIVYASGFPGMTIGLPLYMSESVGAITHTPPATADDAVRVIGWAVHADKIFFNPSADYVTVV